MKRFLFVFGLAVTLISCGRSYEKLPLDKLIQEHSSDKSFSFILDDMQEEGVFFQSFYHKYKVVYEREDDKLEEYTTNWLEVPEKYFWNNENNLGMELVSKGEDGKLNKSAAPAGFNNYVGNPRYGSWHHGTGGSFWQFYGQYMFMSSMFNLMSRPVYRSHYDDYRGSYRGSRPYYGPKGKSGGYAYGTRSKFQQSKRPNYFQRRAARSGYRSSSSRAGRSGSRWGGGRGRGFGK